MTKGIIPKTLMPVVNNHRKHVDIQRRTQKIVLQRITNPKKFISP